MKVVIAIGAGLLALLCGCLAAIPMAAMSFFTVSEDPARAGVCPLDPGEASGDWGEAQLANAQTIYTVGLELGMGERAAVIAIATSMQEAKLQIYANDNPDWPEVHISLDLPHQAVGHDHDSVGLFQQRPSAGWGTVEELMDPAISAERFYNALADVDGWESMTLTQAAQKVQVSAYPDAYAKWEADATALVAAFAGGGSCAGAGHISGQGWTVPVDYPVNSGFRTSERPTHDGVDLSSPRGTPIVAAAAGTVQTSKCNAHIGGEPYSCDIDGSPEIAGCGWYVDIVHTVVAADGTTETPARTRYCHMGAQPLVKVGDAVTAGQLLGYVGSSGRSSGPHLHFETHLGSNFGPVEPTAFMHDRGAPLVGT